eukprot:3627855-Amphidinium_carterae.1
MWENSCTTDPHTSEWPKSQYLLLVSYCSPGLQVLRTSRKVIAQHHGRQKFGQNEYTGGILG